MSDQKLMHHYLVALGSNLGNRQQTFRDALARIEAHGESVLARAGIYETAPVGAVADQAFLNSAVLISSALSPSDFLLLLQDTEHSLGRVRREKWGNRVIDLDIMLWRDPLDDMAKPTRIIKYPDLEIPHPLMLGRDFMLIPAVDIAPNWVHPFSGLTLQGEAELRRYRCSNCISEKNNW